MTCPDVCPRGSERKASSMAVDLGLRVYGAAQQMIARYTDDESAPGVDRYFISEDDAYDALVQALIGLDLQRSQGMLPQDHALHIASMIVVAAQYIKPLPAGPNTVGRPDLFTSDLMVLVKAIRESRDHV